MSQAALSAVTENLSSLRITLPYVRQIKVACSVYCSKLALYNLFLKFCVLIGICVYTYRFVFLCAYAKDIIKPLKLSFSTLFPPKKVSHWTWACYGLDGLAVIKPLQFSSFSAPPINHWDDSHKWLCLAFHLGTRGLISGPPAGRGSALTPWVIPSPCARSLLFVKVAFQKPYNLGR